VRPSLIALSLLLLPGCPKSAPQCEGSLVGDPAQPPEGEILWTDGRSKLLAALAAGQAVPLEPPPQGGYVMYIGARVKNMHTCVEIGGRLRDPASGNEVGFDARSSRLVPNTDGYAWPDPSDNSNVANVNGCPAYGPRDVHATPYDLEVTITDRDGRKLTLKQRIVPTCMLADPSVQADCTCTCAANYCLGKCGADGSVGSCDMN